MVTMHVTCEKLPLNVLLFSVWNHAILFTAYFDYKEDGVFPKPPSYNVATTLPSYDEAERTKAETSPPQVTGRVSGSLFLFSVSSCYLSTLSHSNIHTDRTFSQRLPELLARQEVCSALDWDTFMFLLYLITSVVWTKQFHKTENCSTLTWKEIQWCLWKKVN